MGTARNSSLVITSHSSASLPHIVQERKLRLRGGRDWPAPDLHSRALWCLVRVAMLGGQFLGSVPCVPALDLDGHFVIVSPTLISLIFFLLVKKKSHNT